MRNGLGYLIVTNLIGLVIFVNAGVGYLDNICGGIKDIIKHSVTKFILVGFLNTMFGYSLYSILVFLGLPYLQSLLLTTIVGVIFNYFSLGKLVFQQAGGRITFVKFIFVYFIVYLFNAIALEQLVEVHQINPYMSQLTCLVPSVVFNWFMFKMWVFK